MTVVPPEWRVFRRLSLVVAISLVAVCGSARDASLDAASLHIRKAAVLNRDYPASALRDLYLQRELRRAEEWIDSLRKGQAGVPRPGLAEEAYFSEIDQSAQPFYRYLPKIWFEKNTDEKNEALPLLVYLHGYFSDMDLINWAIFPTTLTNLAETVGACVAMPFARSNTDFQGIGEQDVMRVIDEMQRRYGTDPQRVVLLGLSMGGMGTWTIGARFAECFNGLLIIAGRGDYDFWHKLEPGALPAWERELIDAQFLPKLAPRLAGMPILAYHGSADYLIPPAEAGAAFGWVSPVNPAARLVMLPEGDHWISDEVLARPDCAEWLSGVLAKGRDNRPAALGIVPGEVPSRIQQAFLQPFIFVQPSNATLESEQLFARHCAAWESFAKARPVTRREAALTESELREKNLFVFGSAGESPFARLVLESHAIETDDESWNLQGRKVAREGHGLWIALPNPLNRERTVVINDGIYWGERLSPNHRYDMLPDLLVYTAEPGRLGINRPVCAGKIDRKGLITWWPQPEPVPVK